MTTEQEWLTSSDPEAMLTCLLSLQTPSARKLRLFAIACCRRIWPLLMDERSRQAVEAAEEFADGKISKARFREAWDAEGSTACGHADDGVTARDMTWGAGWAAESAAESIREMVAAEHRQAYLQELKRGDELSSAALQRFFRRERTAFQGERKVQSALLRDIVGNPFRAPPVLAMAWQTSDVQRLAQQAYTGAFDLMPLLDAALEEAGCQDQEILSHCRDEERTQVHVRGCWLVDTALARN